MPARPSWQGHSAPVARHLFDRALIRLADVFRSSSALDAEAEGRAGRTCAVAEDKKGADLAAAFGCA